MWDFWFVNSDTILPVQFKGIVNVFVLIAFDRGPWSLPSLAGNKGDICLIYLFKKKIQKKKTYKYKQQRNNNLSRFTVHHNSRQKVCIHF